MNLNIKYVWENITTQSSRSYTCGHCGSPLASQTGYKGKATYQGKNFVAYIYSCHFCSRPTYFDTEGDQVPGVAFGNEVKGIDDVSVSELYKEARNSTGANCNTAAVLCCRKLLMHIAVSKGADEGKSFAYYVDFLAEKNYVPPDAKAWVDHIREKGNEANHEINLMSSDDAKELLSFVEMLLKIIYEFPATVKEKYAKPKQ